MELDDLRRQWRQPEPVQAPAPLTATELARLAARQSGSIVEKLRHNARLELGINYGVLVAAGALAGLASPLWLRLFGGLLGVLALVCIYYFYRKLGLLRRMDDPAGDLRVHLGHLTTGLRALMRFYYRLTLAMLPITALLMGGLTYSKKLGGFSSPSLWLILGIVAAQVAVLYWPVSRATGWYLQQLYGQHLDRLEAQLHELEEERQP